jgi:hypothetical protein
MATKQIALRVDETLLDRLDRMIAALKEDPEYRVMDINRSVAIRMLVERGLLAWELRLGLDQEDWFKLDEATFEFWARRLAEWSSEHYRMGRVQLEWTKRARESGFFDQMLEDSEKRAAIAEHYARKVAEAEAEAAKDEKG